MSSAALADEGTKAVAAGKYTEGIDKLSQALKERPAPRWLLERSKAYLRTNDFDLALHDAEQALEVAFSRANRDYMIEAQIRRAITLFRMGRYADADICAFWAIRLLEQSKATEDDGQQDKVGENGDYVVRASDIKNDEKPDKDRQIAAAMGGTGNSKNTSLKNQANSWRLQALNKLESLPAGHPGLKVNVSKYPKPSNGHDTAASPVLSTQDEGHDEGAKRDAWEKVWNKFSTAFAANSIRSSFYQTDTTINADFFVKNVPADRFTVSTQPQKVVMGPISNTDSGSNSLQLHLWGRVKPAETKHTVKSMKVELVLKKETPGKWPMLQREDSDGFTNIAGNTIIPPSFERFSTLISRLGYHHPDDLELPDSGSDLKAWYGAFLGKVAVGLDGHDASSEIPNAAPEATSSSTSASAGAGAGGATQPKSNPTQASDAIPKPTPNTSKAYSTKTVGSAPAYPTSSKKGAVNWDRIGDDDGDDESKEDADVNSFFQKLYKDADDDTRRAMMKSYVESNGTSLSTSWAEAKSKTYKTLPPEGAEAKQWDD
ncbi:SGS-domain-containing protein [Daldinia vernicosa]|uniref:SGS-domain-containing protein n=1 Tax=Daldinia vernicosa TaxID=114800 RepID=UPI00200860A1|nr:SGS-domain-containing protein [Daldinia vernicosa]KAI0849177.1 SGS-domain-containing protein [Daldinia vernicosa]